MARIPRPRLPRPRLPRPRGLRSAARRVRFALGAAVRATGRALRSLATRLRDAWLLLSPVTRAYAAGAVLLAALAAAVWFGAPGVPCQLPAGDRCPPADDAAELVPADALAYLHTNLDPDTDQYEEAAALADELPNLSRQLIALAPTPGGVGGGFERRVVPWLGGEVALAILPAERGAPRQAFLLEVGDAEGAEDFAGRAAEDATTVERGGVEVAVGENGVASAIASGFVLVGEEEAVLALAELAGDGDDGSLAGDATAQRVENALPGDSLVQAYVSGEGITRLLAGAGGTLGTLDTFINYEAAEAAGAALVASDDGIELEIHSELDPERRQRSPGVLEAFPPFEPQLAEDLPPDTLAYLGLGDPAASVGRLLRQAASDAPGFLEAIQGLARDLRQEDRVSLEKEVLALLGDEGAFAIGPPAEQRRRGGSDGPRGVAAPAGVPYVEFIGTGVDTEAASEALAKLQGPLARSLDPGEGGQAPVFKRRMIDGVPSHSVVVSAAVELSYAAFDGRLVTATQPAGVRRAILGEGGLADSDAFESGTDDFPDRPALLLYMDLAGLVRLAEREGLAQDPAYAFVAKEIRKLFAAGLAVERGDTELTTHIRVAVSQGP